MRYGGVRALSSTISIGTWHNGGGDSDEDVGDAGHGDGGGASHDGDGDPDRGDGQEDNCDWRIWFDKLLNGHDNCWWEELPSKVSEIV